MLSYIRLKNFKSFSDIMLDLRGKGGVPKKLVFIYGENGSGKSNLISSLLFLSKTITSIKSQARLKKFTDAFLSKAEDKEINPSVRNEILEQFIKSRIVDIEDLIKENKTLNSKDTLEMEVGFYLDGVEGTYILSFDTAKVIYEELRYKINERVGMIFQLSEEKIKMSPSIFFDSAYTRELKENIEKYWGKHTFMSILDNEIFTKNRRFVESRIHKNIIIVLEWFQKHSILCKKNLSETGKFALPFHFLSSLESGIVKTKDDIELLAFEKILNEFFTSLYSDVKRVYYNFDSTEDGLQYELYFKKLLNGKILEIPFKLESTGTQKLLKIFPYVFSAISGSSVFVDEIDSGIHDLLMCEIVELLSDALELSQKGQLIATTHNTLLMKQLENENVYILSSDAEGNKDIVSVDKYAFRTQKTHSIQSKYLNGDYSGIPITGYLDFSEMVEDVINYINNDEDFFA